MRVLIFSQHFTPEITAARSRVAPIAEILAARGHEVEVLTALPNHPQGIVHDGYRGKLALRRELDGYTVRYLWVRTSPHKTMSSRLLLYGSYATTATLAGFAARRPDVIFATSPPLPVAAAARLVAARHRVPWVMDVRDIWPEVAVVLGELTNKRMIEAAERLERGLYSSAAAIVTVTDSFAQDIAERTEDRSKISVIRNGTTRAWIDAAEIEVAKADLGLPEDRFVWTYAGNVGIAQGLDVAVDAAEQLGPDFQLRIIGEGPLLEPLKQQAERLPPGQVVFAGLMEPDQVARYLRASDASLVSLADRPELAKFIPSKLYDYCAVGRPVILSAAGEARSLATDADAAYAVDPGDATGLADAVRALRADPELRERLSERGRSFAAGFLREAQVERLDELLQDVVRKA